MATRTLKLNKVIALALTSSGGEYGNGQEQHLSVGYWSGWRYRALLASDAAPNWDGFYQLQKAELKLKVTSVHVGIGGSARTIIRRITESWNDGTGGSEGSWGPAATGADWPGPATTGTNAVDKAWSSPSAGDYVKVDVTQLIRAVLPASVLDDNGNPGGGQTWRGLRLASYDEDAASRTIEFSSDKGSFTPELIFTYDDNQPPLAPTDLVPLDGSVEASSTGKQARIAGTFRDNDGTDYLLGLHVQVHADTTTDAQLAGGSPPDPVAEYQDAAYGALLGEPLEFSVTFGSGVFPAGGAGSGYPGAQYLPQRTWLRYRVRCMDQEGAWGAWSTVDDHRFRTNAKPSITTLTASTDSRVPDFSGTLVDPDPGSYITAAEVEVYYTPPGGSTVTLMATGKQAVGGTSTRATIGYSSTVLPQLEYGQKYRWKMRLWDADDSPSDWSSDQYVTPLESVGPTAMVPRDLGTKLNSLTPRLTVGHNLTFDGYAVELYTANEAVGTALVSSGTVSTSTTTLAAAASLGATNIKVTSVAGISVGDTLRIADAENVVVSAVGTAGSGGTGLTVSALASARNNGDTVRTIGAAYTVPAAKLDWGRTYWWRAAVRLTGQPGLGPWSPLFPIYVNTLPAAPSLSVST